MADSAESDGPDPHWTVRLAEVERLDRDDGDEGEDFYDVTFELSGLGVSGSMSVLITDPVHDATVIAGGFEQLHRGLETFARVVERRKRIELPKP